MPRCKSLQPVGLGPVHEIRLVSPSFSSVHISPIFKEIAVLAKIKL